MLYLFHNNMLLELIELNGELRINTVSGCKACFLQYKTGASG